jgi:hypothetical protein
MELVEEKQNKTKTIDILDANGESLSFISDKTGERQIREGILTITPSMAKILLERNPINRSVKPANVAFLTKEIREGRWTLNGESITFSKNGNLINGQHRLKAIIAAEKPIRVKVTYGIDESAISTIDTGNKRIIKDVFDMAGIHNSTLLSGSIKLINQFINGSYGDIGGASRVLSNQEALDYYYENEDELEISVSMANTLYKKSGHLISTNIILTLHYLFARKSKVQAKEFFDKLCTGIGLVEQSPITVLRNKLVRNNMDTKNKMSQKEKVELIIFAWNKFRNGETCKTLKIPTEAPLKIK